MVPKPPQSAARLSDLHSLFIQVIAVYTLKDDQQSFDAQVQRAAFKKLHLETLRLRKLGFIGH